MICPLLGVCKERVTLEKYREFCANMSADKYKECPVYQRETATPRTPAEWSRLLSGMMGR